MTAEQKQLVRESFPAVREVAGPVSKLFYGRLFALDPSLRPMFRQDIELQGRKLMDMLTAVVDSLDHFEGLAPVLRALGQKHVGYGVEFCHSASTESINLSRRFLCREQDYAPEPDHRDQRSESRAGCNSNAPAICAMGSFRLPCLLRKREL